MKANIIMLALASLIFCFACSSKNKGEAKNMSAKAEKADSSQAALASQLASPEELAEALQNAAFYGDLAEVQRLLKAGANVDAKSSLGFTPLMRASERGNVEIARALLQAGADCDVARDNGSTALMDASSGNQPEVLKVLIEAGADPNAKTTDGTGVMFWAAGYGHTEVVRILVKAGTRIEDPVDRFGTTPLMHAVRNGKAETVAALLELGAKVNARDTSGKTALSHAKEKGDKGIVDILLKAEGIE